MTCSWARLLVLGFLSLLVAFFLYFYFKEAMIQRQMDNKLLDQSASAKTRGPDITVQPIKMQVQTEAPQLVEGYDSDDE